MKSVLSWRFQPGAYGSFAAQSSEAPQDGGRGVRVVHTGAGTLGTRARQEFPRHSQHGHTHRPCEYRAS